MGGYIGCCTKPPLTIVVDKPSKELRYDQGPKAKTSSKSEDLWSTRMDNSVVLSHRSISSTSALFHPLEDAGSTRNPSEFLNHGFLLWNLTRQKWLGNKKAHQRQPQVRDPDPIISWNATYESLLGTNKPFLQPILLTEMVDFLDDVWSQEGLYD